MIKILPLIFILAGCNQPVKTGQAISDLCFVDKGIKECKIHIEIKR